MSSSIADINTNNRENSDSQQSPAETGNVLTRIVATKAAHIAALKLRFPEASLKPQISDRSLFEALRAPNAGFIFECKKASPSKGLIRADFDVEAIADVYNDYAAGISVLTDEQFFQGDMDYIPKVRARVKQPILCKDFFVDNYQVKLAAHQGADAILLMLSVLDDDQYRALAFEAAKYRLDILTEVSNEAELERAIALDANIIGINNRNLRDLSTDLATTEKLAPRIPADRVVISESGIYNQAQVRRLSPLVDGFLVGSSLMAAADLDLACRTLTLGHNKVCGLTSVEDANAVADAGAIYGGLIFAEKSPRHITPDKAKSLLAAHRASGKQLNFVGVFVNESAAVIAELASSLELFAVQLHGSESEYDIAQVRSALAAAGSQAKIWKAVAVNVAVDISAANAELSLPTNADRILFDSKSSKATGEQFGGTGLSFDWQQSLPNKQDAMLAGGLDADNASDASKQGFYGLDFNSGLESAPGVKDHQLIQSTFAALRQY
ncbi:fused indole-3-glycerolphosphate synthetase; N-(5-phosphoribosyl)anthranilate isomerase [Shewanella benthica]|uniref:Multifunctional fusion protein n=1 Tax=Shewanella benthica TaxID=43661 RepID=A0A330M5G9_9GAMM|nr:bifunctional indole-3-glycerol-phosphate synthase TrpC/phosphoribosylanthranilate isomerase TrpF [Shewanella benthica]SQH77215.1 fused indole-3-glycerolphosphate synthetase; N-(5-phosphoribosyl)anthranilate isomerase [Shewanella benthica]